MTPFNSRTDYVLILGGTSGLGRELYTELSRRGRRAIIVGRRPIQLLSPLDVHITCDFESEQITRELIVRLKSFGNELKQIRDFFWVSGVLERAPFFEIERDQILKMVDVNLRNPLLVAQWMWAEFTTAPTSAAAGGEAPSRSAAHFTVVSSTTGVSDSPRDDEAVYAATKAAQVSLARALGKANKKADLKVSLFCPGGMRTDFWTGKAILPEVLETFLDPAQVAAKICSDNASQAVPFLEVMIPRGSLPTPAQEPWPRLETERLVLREFRLQDAKRVQLLAGDEKIAATTSGIPHPYPDGMAETWIASHRGLFDGKSAVQFAVELKQTGELIGCISLFGMTSENPKAEIGYWIGVDYWNNGYGSEAAKALAHYGFDVLKLRKLTARHVSSNPASGKIMLKIGMHREGWFKKDLLRNGKTDDMEIYALFADDFPKTGPILP